MIVKAPVRLQAPGDEIGFITRDGKSRRQPEAEDERQRQQRAEESSGHPRVSASASVAV